MSKAAPNMLHLHQTPSVNRPTLILALSGWMDGGDVSTGTVERLVGLFDAEVIADIDPEEFYIYNLPGSMELSAMFRPHIEIEEGIIQRNEFPTNQFYCHEAGDLLFFIGKEPNMRWRQFGDCIFDFSTKLGVQRIIFVGSFGGTVPHTREPRMFATGCDDGRLTMLEQYDVRRTGYSGPGAFISYMMTRAPDEAMEMFSLIAEIPSYLHGRNPTCIEAVTRRLAKILQLPLDLDTLRTASTEWELEMSRMLDGNEEVQQRIRELEENYDNELIGLPPRERDPGEEGDVAFDNDLF